ncbi:hypothetical protein D3C78_925930 [compost metagenome]
MGNYPRTTEDQVVARLSRHVEAGGEFAGHAALQQHHLRCTCIGGGDGHHGIYIAPPGYGAGGAADVPIDQGQIGMSGDAQSAFVPFKASLAQQPVGQQGLAQRGRHRIAPGGADHHIDIRPAGARAAQRFGGAR